MVETKGSRENFPWHLSSRSTPVGRGSLLNNLEIGDAGHIERLEHFFGISINLKDILSVNIRHLGNVVVASLTFLLLQLNGDPSDWSSLDSLHEVSCETSDLVPEALAWNDGDLLSNALIGMEVRA